jgi:hypothetical protein
MNGNGVWKWIAITLAAFMLGGVPGYIYQYLNAPTKEDVDHIRETQQLVLLRLGVLEERVMNLEEEIQSLKEAG